MKNDLTRADAQPATPIASGPQAPTGWFRQVFGKWTGVGKFLSVAMQLGLLVLVVRQFQLENQVFYERIMPLTFGGFLIHYFLPQRYRLSFFIVLSLVGIYAALGFPNSLWLISGGLLFIGICHLPVPFAARVAVLLAGAVILVLLRRGQIQVAWASVVLPILASMFMFRIMVYLYDLKHQKGKTSIQYALAYFFMLPNVVFPLFPVVDYSTFCRTYYDRDRHQIYQKGINLMLLGILELILYRAINYYWMIPPEDVKSLSNLAQYLAANYLLILWLIGLFTLVVGMLHMFGFNLPKPMQRFFLAASFTDFWRRANVYWKDFMQKVFFYPLYFRLRKSNATVRLLLALAIVFACTWFFHAYQWFWIRGSFLLTAPDLLFWAIFGVLVIANSIYENKRGRQNTLAQRTNAFPALVPHTLRVMGLFFIVTVLCSLWTSTSVADWVALWSNANLTLSDLIKFIPTLVLTFSVFLAATFIFESAPQPAANIGMGPFFRTAVAPGAAIVLLFLSGKPAVLSPFGNETQEAIRDLQTARLNQHEVELLTRGYYENLNAANQFNSRLWELDMKKSDNDWPMIQETPAGRVTNDFMRLELVPSTRVNFHSARLTINRWGFRDRDYQQKKPQGVYRIAVLGASGPFGSGVSDDETFEAILEARLNHENNGKRYAKYEILNFSVPGYCMIRQIIFLEKKVVAFEPDAVFLCATPRDEISLARHLTHVVKDGDELPFDFLRTIVQKAEVNDDMSFEQIFTRLKEFGDEALVEAFPRFTRICREHNILPVYVLTPVVTPAPEKLRRDAKMSTRFMNLAQAAGFTIIDLSSAFEGHAAEELRVTEWDLHPNAKGHQLLADHLYEALGESSGLRLAAK
ncbi:hypothetical protein HUU05_17235 [candidate division KSB1 bacterium]|nr:hypothetical protein [candidate division KSB1 bacterium]